MASMTALLRLSEVEAAGQADHKRRLHDPESNETEQGHVFE
jgi:hypothetical protein